MHSFARIRGPRKPRVPSSHVWLEFPTAVNCARALRCPSRVRRATKPPAPTGGGSSSGEVPPGIVRARSYCPGGPSPCLDPLKPLSSIRCKSGGSPPNRSLISRRWRSSSGSSSVASALSARQHATRPLGPPGTPTRIRGTTSSGRGRWSRPARWCTHGLGFPFLCTSGLGCRSRSSDC